MKTEQDVDKARSILCDRIIKEEHKLNESQLALLKGMLCGLIWVADGKHDSTMQRLLSGEPIK